MNSLMLDDSRRSLKCEAGYAHPPTGRGTLQHSAQIERALVVDPTNPTIKLNLGAIAMAQRLRLRASQDR